MSTTSFPYFSIAEQPYSNLFDVITGETPATAYTKLLSPKPHCNTLPEKKVAISPPEEASGITEIKDPFGYIFLLLRDIIFLLFLFFFLKKKDYLF